MARIAAPAIVGGGSYALAKSNSGTITACVSHKGGALYKASKCHKHGKKLSWNKQGIQGAPGATGLQGPQGPSGSILIYDASASASPMTPIGTVLGDALFAECATPVAGEAQTKVFVQTRNGAWDADYGIVDSTGGAAANNVNVPAGTLTSPAAEVLVQTGVTPPSVAQTQYEWTQLPPVPGSMVWHIAARSTVSSLTCHISVTSIPETIVGSVAAARSPSQRSVGP